MKSSEFYKNKRNKINSDKVMCEWLHTLKQLGIITWSEYIAAVGPYLHSTSRHWPNGDSVSGYLRPIRNKDRCRRIKRGGHINS